MTNLLGVHALVWSGTWDEAGARRAISSAGAAGFDLIEVPILDPYGIDTAMTRRLLDEYGMQASCSMGLPAEADVSSEDPAVLARGKELLGRAVEVAQELGATFLCGVLYSQLGKYPAPITDRSRAHVVEGIQSLSERAGAAGVSVSLEVVNRYESNVVNTAEQMLTLLDDAGVDVGVHLDTYHMNIEEDGFAKPVEQCGQRLGYVHIGESHRGYLGTGTIDFDEFFDALLASGYSGPVTFESFSSAVVHPSLSNQLAVWRNLWNSGDDLAGHARSFIAQRLKLS
ncbi:MAG TPA: sugar phosphate isomerase/epimerase family protein [Nocardioidaceae bacterium]|jgi:D-psicose/D-tagatose/L-ribulose 3-epimerase